MIPATGIGDAAAASSSLMMSATVIFAVYLVSIGVQFSSNAWYSRVMTAPWKKSIN